MYDPQAGGKQGLCHQYCPKAGAVSPIQLQRRGCVTNTAPTQGLCHQYCPKAGAVSPIQPQTGAVSPILPQIRAMSPIQLQRRGCVTNTAPTQGLCHQYCPNAGAVSPIQQCALSTVTYSLIAWTPCPTWELNTSPSLNLANAEDMFKLCYNYLHVYFHGKLAVCV